MAEDKKTGGITAFKDNTKQTMAQLLVEAIDVAYKYSKDFSDKLGSTPAGRNAGLLVFKLERDKEWAEKIKSQIK